MTLSLNYPSELTEQMTLFCANVFQFNYKDFTVCFELETNESSELHYHINFTYRHNPQINQILRIGSEGYSNLLLKAMIAKRLPFDIAHNVNQGRLTRVDIIRDHSLKKELLFHAQCVVFLFQIMDQIMDTHKKHYDEYCLEIIRQEEIGRIEDSFTKFFLIRACHLLLKGGLEYYGKEVVINEEITRMAQLW